jgi:hypothetical protein
VSSGILFGGGGLIVVASEDFCENLFNSKKRAGALLGADIEATLRISTLRQDAFVTINAQNIGSLISRYSRPHIRTEFPSPCRF